MNEQYFLLVECGRRSILACKTQGMDDEAQAGSALETVIM